MREHDRDATDEFEPGVEEGYDIAAARARRCRVSATECAEEAYTRAYLSAVDLVEDIDELLRDVPAPSEIFTPNWEHVGSLVEVTHRLEAVVAFLTRIEGRGAVEMAGTFVIRITESSGEIHDLRYRLIWSAWLDGVLLGKDHAYHPDETLTQAQKLVDPEGIDDLKIDYRSRSARWP